MLDVPEPWRELRVPLVYTIPMSEDIGRDITHGAPVRTFQYWRTEMLFGEPHAIFHEREQS